jgi:hypothetical protein
MLSLGYLRRVEWLLKPPESYSGFQERATPHG